MKNIFLLFVFAVMSLHAGKIRIACAANVSYAIAPLVEAFKLEHPETNIELILGSSGKLTAQIKHGAPYDLFLSANMRYPQALYEADMSLDKPRLYAQGALALLSVKARQNWHALTVLQSPEIKKIAIANPKTAPYGVATVEALKNAGVYETLKDKFVYGESISQTIIYATTAADIGIVAKSSLYAPQMLKYKQGIHWSDVDERLYAPIDQGMIMLKQAEANAEVKAFYDFMLSAKAKEILRSFGYKV